MLMVPNPFQAPSISSNQRAARQTADPGVATIASTSFTTTETGLLQIKATISTGTTISNSTALYATPTLYDVIAGAAFADAQVSGSSVLSGGRFGFVLYNLSNRDSDVIERQSRPAPISFSTRCATHFFVITHGILSGYLSTIH